MTFNSMIHIIILLGPTTTNKHVDLWNRRRFLGFLRHHAQRVMCKQTFNSTKGLTTSWYNLMVVNIAKYWFLLT